MTIGKVQTLCEAGLLVPPDWRLPSGWKISAGGYAVPPLPVGRAYDEYVTWRWSELTPEARADPTWAEDSQMWGPIFAAERDAAITATYGPYGDPYNRYGRRNWWRGRQVDAMLAQHGYMPGTPPFWMPRRPHYVEASPPVRPRRMTEQPAPPSRPVVVKREARSPPRRTGGIVFRPVIPKAKTGLRVPKKEKEEFN
ncbi:hypothetical protein ACQ4PT_034720 [Festuca glaucescens]